MGQVKTTTKQLNDLVWSNRITKNNRIKTYETTVLIRIRIMAMDIAGQTKLDIIKNIVTATQMRLAY